MYGRAQGLLAQCIMGMTADGFGIHAAMTSSLAALYITGDKLQLVAHIIYTVIVLPFLIRHSCLPAVHAGN